MAPRLMVSNPFAPGCPPDRPAPVLPPAPSSVLPEGWRTMRKSRLEDLADTLGINVDGTRDDIIARLEHAAG